MADLVITLSDQYTGTADQFDLPDNYTLQNLLDDIRKDEGLGPTDKEWPEFASSGGFSFDGSILRANTESPEAVLLTKHGLAEGGRVEILKDCNVAG